MGTTIFIDLETKEKLNSIKVHEREPYDDVIKRLLISFMENKKI